MLYLEDYLEMIEHLPQELRDRFTEMREMDLSVQNAMDVLEKRVKIFFSNAKRLGKLEKEMEHENIRRDYYKTLEDADEKVQLANQMYELVDRYLRRLDSELFKFKIELEADNSGITEILEKRSLELDLPQMNSVNREKENRYSFGSRSSGSHGKQKKRRDSSASNATAEKRSSGDKSSGSSHGHSHGHSHSHSHGSHGHGSHGHGSHGHGHSSHGHGSHGHSHGHSSHSHRDSSRDSHREGHSSHRDSHNHREVHAQALRDSHIPVYSQNHSHSTHNQIHSQSHIQQTHSQPPPLIMSSISSVPSMDVRPGSAGSGGSVAPILQQQTSSSAASPNSGVSYSLGHIGAGGNAIAAAASQAIAATQQGFLKPVKVKKENIKKFETSASFFQTPGGIRLVDPKEAAAKSIKVKKVSENNKKLEGNQPFCLKQGGTKPMDSKEGTVKPVKSKKSPMSCKKLDVNATFFPKPGGSKPVDHNKEMQQGRRTASLKASYEAINIGGVHSHDFTIGREIAGAAQTALAAIHDIPKKKKKSSSSAQAAAAAAAAASATSSSAASSSLSGQGSISHSAMIEDAGLPTNDTSEDGVLDPNAEGVVDGDNVDWTYDPNEPRYCLCNQVSYGDMVACDNEDCPFEWFHYPCVGITASPKGKWYCPQCASAMKRRGRKN